MMVLLVWWWMVWWLMMVVETWGSQSSELPNRNRKGRQGLGVGAWSWYSDWKHLISWYLCACACGALRWPFHVLSMCVLEDQGNPGCKVPHVGLELPPWPWMTDRAGWMSWMLGARILGRWRFLHPVSWKHDWVIYKSCKLKATNHAFSGSMLGTWSSIEVFSTMDNGTNTGKETTWFGFYTVQLLKTSQFGKPTMNGQGGAFSTLDLWDLCAARMADGVGAGALGSQNDGAHWWMICWFPETGVPQNGWFRKNNPFEICDLGLPPFLESPI